MTKNEFIQNFADVLAADPGQVAPSAALNDFSGWDSMAQLSAVALLDQVGVKPPPGALQKCVTVQDLINLAGDKLT
jgi:acyl carrier protein